MPDIEETQTMRPLGGSRPPSRSASLIRSSLERLISISEVQRSSGILAIVRSRVTPALWTTMSTPPESCAAICAGAVGVQGLGDRLADAARGAGHQGELAVERLRPVARRRLGDRGADLDHLA